MRINRALGVAGATCAAGLALVGIANGLHRAAGTPSAAPDVRRNAGAVQRVAEFAPEGGRSARQVVLQRTPDGYLCVWDSPDGTADHGVGGCNPAGDPLAGHKVFVSLAYDGGPAITAVQDARLSGLAAADVASAQLVMTDGSTRTILLSPGSTRAVAGRDYRPFAYRVHRRDLDRGIGPVAVLVLDAQGNVLDRQVTGIG